jgi:hypothetical protein
VSWQPVGFADLLHLSSLGAYNLEPIVGIEHQHNTYFDTPDRRPEARGKKARGMALLDRALGILAPAPRMALVVGTPEPV